LRLLPSGREIKGSNAGSISSVTFRLFLIAFAMIVSFSFSFSLYAASSSAERCFLPILDRRSFAGSKLEIPFFASPRYSSF